MKSKDLLERTSEDLRELQGSLKRDLFSYRMKNHTNQLDDTSLLSKTRRDIARIQQILEARVVAESTKGGES